MYLGSYLFKWFFLVGLLWCFGLFFWFVVPFLVLMLAMLCACYAVGMCILFFLSLDLPYNRGLGGFCRWAWYWCWLCFLWNVCGSEFCACLVIFGGVISVLLVGVRMKSSRSDHDSLCIMSVF